MSRQRKIFLAAMVILLAVLLIFQFSLAAFRIANRDELLKETIRANPEIVAEVVNTDANLCETLGGNLDGDEGESLCVLLTYPP